MTAQDGAAGALRYDGDERARGRWAAAAENCQNAFSSAGLPRPRKALLERVAPDVAGLSALGRGVRLVAQSPAVLVKLSARAPWGLDLAAVVDAAAAAARGRWVDVSHVRRPEDPEPEIVSAEQGMDGHQLVESKRVAKAERMERFVGRALSEMELDRARRVAGIVQTLPGISAESLGLALGVSSNAARLALLAVATAVGQGATLVVTQTAGRCPRVWPDAAAAKAGVLAPRTPATASSPE